jgi:hypothetical protein
VTAMYIGGVLRSEVDFRVMRPNGLEDLGAAWKGPEGGIQYYTNETTGVYYVCNIQEWRHGNVLLGALGCDGSNHPGTIGGTAYRTEVYNDYIRFDRLSPPVVDWIGTPIETLTLQEGEATLHELPANIFNHGVLLIVQLHIPCPFSYGAQVRASTTLVHEGAHYLYDPRLLMVENTIASPADFSSLTEGVQGRTCPLLHPSAPKTMLNEHGCVVTHGCAPDEYTVHMPLATRTLRCSQLQTFTFTPRTLRCFSTVDLHIHAPVSFALRALFAEQHLSAEREHHPRLLPCRR